MQTALATIADAAGSLAPIPGSPEYAEQAKQGATEIARVYREATAEMTRLWEAFKAEAQRIQTMMEQADASTYSSSFRVDLHYQGTTYHDWNERTALSQIQKTMGVQVWRILFNKMGIKNLMSIKRREEFEKQLKDEQTPEVTEQAILGVLMGLANQAATFAEEAARETLKMLTPTRSGYKTNSAFKVGRRAILTYAVRIGYGARGTFQPGYHAEERLIALDGTFHVLDGRGVIKGRESPLVGAIRTAEEGKGQTDFFRFRCFKNGNLHLEFRRLDLVKRLNQLATGEHVLGDDTD